MSLWRVFWCRCRQDRFTQNFDLRIRIGCHMPFTIVNATFWDHGSTEFSTVPTPKWDAVAAELGKQKSASLAGSEQSGETITGFGVLALQRHQAGCLVMATAVGAEKPVWLTDPTRRGTASLGCCGSAKVPAIYLIPDTNALAAAKHFFTTGACDPQLKWVDQPPG